LERVHAKLRQQIKRLLERLCNRNLAFVQRADGDIAAPGTGTAVAISIDADTVLTAAAAGPVVIIIVVVIFDVVAATVIAIALLIAGTGRGSGGIADAYGSFCDARNVNRSFACCRRCDYNFHNFCPKSYYESGSRNAITRCTLRHVRHVLPLSRTCLISLDRSQTY